MKPLAEQDGAQFFNEFGRVIAEYSHLVHHDYDISGAITARKLFAQEHPEYRLEEVK